LKNDYLLTAATVSAHKMELKLNLKSENDILVNEVFEEINLIYPIPGHSYLDNDRDFGLIEKQKKKFIK
jgi:hypothetical protein